MPKTKESKAIAELGVKSAGSKSLGLRAKRLQVWIVGSPPGAAKNGGDTVAAYRTLESAEKAVAAGGTLQGGKRKVIGATKETTATVVHIFSSDEDGSERFYASRARMERDEDGSGEIRSMMLI